jgi:hypothetical protein
MTRDEKILWTVVLILAMLCLCRRRWAWLGVAGEVDGVSGGGGIGIGFGGGGGSPGGPVSGGGGCCNRCGSVSPATTFAPGDPSAPPPSSVSCPGSDPFTAMGGGCCYWGGTAWGYAPLNHPACTGEYFPTGSF